MSLWSDKKTMGPESLDTSLFDMLKKSYGGIGSLMGESGLPGRSENFTPPKNPLDILLAERGFQVPERNLGGITGSCAVWCRSSNRSDAFWR
jgi:hypothetical protein